MPIARFEMPDGRIGRFEVPEGTTPEQAQLLIQQSLSVQQPTAPQEVPEQNLWQKARPYVGPVVEGLGMGLGAVAGATAGVPASPSLVANPATLGVAGAGLGYAGGKELMELGDQFFGDKAPRTATETVGDVAGNLATGAAFEMGGQALFAVPAAIRAAHQARVDRKAAEFIRKAAGPELPQITKAAEKSLRRQSAGAAPETVAQATASAGVVAPTITNLTTRAEMSLGKEALKLQQEQEARRLAALVSKTPDLAKAEAARTATSKPLYDAADRAVLPNVAQAVDRAGQPLLQRPSIQAALNAAEKTALDKGIVFFDKSGNLTGQGAHLVKLELDDLASGVGKNAAGNAALSGARASRDEFLTWVENAVPSYAQARQAFATGSVPVNQSKGMTELTNRLRTVDNVAERPNMFLNALENTWKSVTNRAGVPRYGSPNQLFNPLQMKAINRTANQLRRDATVAAQSPYGAQSANNLIGQVKEPLQTPGWFSPAVTAFNTVARKLQGKVSEKTLNRVSEAMLNNRDMLELLNQLPPRERMIVLRELRTASPGATTATMGVVGTNALADYQ